MSVTFIEMYGRKVPVRTGDHTSVGITKPLGLEVVDFGKNYGFKHMYQSAEFLIQEGLESFGNRFAEMRIKALEAEMEEKAAEIKRLRSL